MLAPTRSRASAALASLLGIVCLGMLLFSALARDQATVGRLGQLRSADAKVRQLPGLTLINAAPLAEGEFLLRAASLIPVHAIYRLRVGQGPGCGNDPLSFYWIAYELLPRAAVCTGHPTWWVLYGAGSGPIPRGSRIVLQPNRYMRVLEAPTRRSQP